MMATVSRLPGARLSSGPLGDVAIAAVALASSLAILSHGGIAPFRADRDEPDLLAVALIACSAVPLVAWRRIPVTTFTITAAAATAAAILGHPLDLMPGPMIALYLLAASRSSLAPWTARATTLVAVTLLAYLGATAVAVAAFPTTELLHTGLAWAVAWFAGERTRLRREQLAALRERAQRAERARERERELAATEERARIARDLHDSAGHAINVIAVRAGAARLRHRQDPERSVLALEAIEDLARKTVEEIDHIVGTLRARDSANGTGTAPIGLASLDTLVASHAEAGLDVTVDASPRSRALALGVAADQAAYRILQEALTNAARHGGGSAGIKITVDDTGVELIVTNPVATTASNVLQRLAAATGDGRAGGEQASGGHGLIGMQERVSLLGGTLQAGRSGGEFRVHARIPCRGHVA
jgi:signal transduction histidine kinase